MLRSSKCLLGWLVALSLALPLAVVAATDDLVAAGQRIYREGVLPSGKPLTGVRLGDVVVTAAEAACIKCHRRSGMGSVEGEILVAPITGNYLFLPPDKTLLANMDPRRGKSFNLKHPPYDDASLALAIRHGRNANGLTMNRMMPRYALDDDAMQALTAYLRQLTTDVAPGTTGTSVRFATIVTPGIPEARRKVFLDMVRGAVVGKNASTVLGVQKYGRRHMTSAAEMVLGTERRWELDIWELEGEPSTWGAQLAAYYAKAPVFAVMSGLGNGNWGAVHEFCEAQQLPCWFPVTDVPPERPDDFYSIYFSRGVLLEADVLASHWQTRPTGKPAKVRQIFVDDESGQAAADQLQHALAGSGIALESQPWRDGSPQTLGRLLAQAGGEEEVMLWLPAESKPLLAEIAPPKVRHIYLSGQLGAGEHGVPEAWKRAVSIVYPFELPQKRDLNLSYFRQWLRLRRIPMVDELMQARLYFAMTYLTDTMSEMLDNIHRDYLIERAENMISRREGTRVQDEVLARQTMHRATRALLASRRAAGDVSVETAEPETIGQRQSTTAFPRLELAPGQRFASKGAYLVRFADPHSDTIIAETPWIIP